MSLRLAALLSTFALPALAQVPQVVADIGPVHSMVSRVMDGVGEPRLLLPTNVSPHGYAMRPSEAQAMADAEVIFWVGEDLAPWLGKAVEALGPDAVSVPLLEVEGTLRVAPEDHADHDAAPKAEEDHADHGHDDHGHDDHDHAGGDPHAWLDPVNGQLWLAAIADVLSRVDPENAIIYAANAEAGQAELDALRAEIEAQLSPVRGKGFITFHDAYASFSNRFDLPSAGAISISDSVPPSAGRIADLRAIVQASAATCVFAEPQFDPALVETLLEGTEARAGVLDPLGATLEPGVALYPDLLRALGTSLATCLTD